RLSPFLRQTRRPGGGGRHRRRRGGCGVWLARAKCLAADVRTYRPASGGEMKPLRRLADVVVTVLLIAVVAVSIYLAATGQIPQEKQTTLIGGAVLIAAIMLGG